MSMRFSTDNYGYIPPPNDCAKDSDCRSDALWCDVPKKRCKSKVCLGGSCVGMPDNACFGTCLPGQTLSCMQELGQCFCKSTGCKSDTDCSSSEWCDVKSSKCQKKMFIGDACGTSADKYCYGNCEQFESLKCYKGVCGCFLKNIPCTTSDSECNSAKLWCNKALQMCLKKTAIGGNCTGQPDSSCIGDCLEGQTLVCSKNSSLCICETGCKDDSLCLKTEWCDTQSWKCQKKLFVGDACGTLSDQFCFGACEDFETMKCNNGVCGCVLKNILQRSSKISCQTSDSECNSAKLWCNKEQQLCLKKTGIGGICTGQPDNSCMGDCLEGQTLVCSKSLGQCVCEINGCKNDTQCLKTEWCDTQSSRCQKKLFIGDACGTSPDKFCFGACEDIESLRCNKGVCGCVLKNISCTTSDSECNSTKLWCNKVLQMCLRRTQIGGDCSGQPNNACVGDCDSGTSLVCSSRTSKCTCEAAGCEKAGDCGENEWCDSDTERCRAKVGLGEDCQTDEYCSGDCAKFEALKCDSSNKCRCLLKKIKCKGSASCRRVDDGLWCNPSAALCQRMKTIGEKCSSGEDEECMGECEDGEPTCHKKKCACM